MGINTCVSICDKCHGILHGYNNKDYWCATMEAEAEYQTVLTSLYREYRDKLARFRNGI